MATFNVVMRSLMSPTSHCKNLLNISRCIFHSHGDNLVFFHTKGNLYTNKALPNYGRRNSYLDLLFFKFREFTQKQHLVLVSRFCSFSPLHSSHDENRSPLPGNNFLSKNKEDINSNERKDVKKESWWNGKNSWRLGLITLGGLCIFWGVGLVSVWGAPQLDPDGKEIQDEFSEAPLVIGYLRRTWKEMNIFKKKIQDPSRDKLLPDPLKYPYIQPPYTLVIELTGVLIHPDWTYGTGWRFKKRPGIEYFLQQVGPPLYEIVIFSSESGMTADPLVNHLDPQGYIMYRLYRDATRYMEGHHVKDLSCLNRDMSRIIMLDCNPQSVKLQTSNAFVLKKWTGQEDDQTLIDLAHFLKTIAASGVDDIRPVLDYYNKFDDPLAAFKENQRRLEEEEERRSKQLKEEKKGWLSGLTSKR
ncbi:mitochondrial import inner membrane translocase subunit TIM50-like [Physella acuta]|uniref:mitochondrial import inner membrane translocase subunit TIM50-like n=1 Tax=Physella acuta TaxID=109671 RepID=UPI0027DC9251|nr:mitochondrial import inner membrane translocase subunit TIM50-like [Physella acuta]